MTNEMRLLRAFIHASGFDIKELRIEGESCDCTITQRDNCSKCRGSGCLPSSDFDYIVTKSKHENKYDIYQMQMDAHNQLCTILRNAQGLGLR